MSKLGLYVHIPFCRQKCLYCDFSSYAGAEHLFSAYTTALCQQIADQGGKLCKPEVDTIYVGGGTPSILPVHLLEQILRNIFSSFTVVNGAEISMEANPGTVSREQLYSIKQFGINRISFGVQSFNDEMVARLGRIHTAKDSIAAIEHANSAGFTNISIDLMYGLPGQNATGFLSELKLAAALDINHISVYGLKVEEDTPLATLCNAGRITLPDDETEEAMYDAMVDFLPSQGLLRYEISNFARQGMECRHNLKYWRYLPYLGLGAAAHSFLNRQRTSNTTDIQDFIDAISSGRSPVVTSETVDEKNAMAEFIFLALRTTLGMELAAFTREFSVDFFHQYGGVVEKLQMQKLLQTDADRIWLTEKGMKFGNVVFCSFLPN